MFIVPFLGGVFSNWHKCTIIDPKAPVLFISAEQAFMWHKAILFGDNDIASQIAKSKNHRRIKSLGRQVANFDQVVWDANKERIMFDILMIKFGNNPDLKQCLLNTGDKIIVEGSQYDTVWGVGIDYRNPKIMNPRNWRGENLLGKSLMKVRGIMNRS